MKKLTLLFGVALMISVGGFQASAFLDYSPNCVPWTAAICVDNQNQDVPDPVVIPPTNPTPGVIPPENPMPGVIPPTNPAPGVVPPTNQKPILDGPAGVHIYHQSIQGHNIYAQSTYQGRGGEIVDLSNFKKDLATFAFDHYSPAEGKITLEAGRNLRAILVYRKVFRPLTQQENPPKSVSSLQKTEWTVASSVYSTPQAEDTKTGHSVDTEDPQVKMITGLFDDFFRRNPQMKKEEKQAFLVALKTSFKRAEQTLDPQDTKNQMIYRLILRVLENYSV